MKNLLMLLILIQAHPMHVSVCEIDYDQQAKSLEITQRIFIDDLELAIRKDRDDAKLELLNPKGSMTTDLLIRAYLQRNFKVFVDGKERLVNYLGHEVENDAFWCYLEIEKIKKPKNIKVYSNILCETYDDQINLVHLQYDGNIKSMKLTPKHTNDTLSF